MINVQELLIPVIKKAQNASIEEAKQEAETTTINTLTAEKMAQEVHNQIGTCMMHVCNNTIQICMLIHNVPMHFCSLPIVSGIAK